MEKRKRNPDEPGRCALQGQKPSSEGDVYGSLARPPGGLDQRAGEPDGQVNDHGQADASHAEQPAVEDAEPGDQSQCSGVAEGKEIAAHRSGLDFLVGLEVVVKRLNRTGPRINHFAVVNLADRAQRHAGRFADLGKLGGL